MRILKEFLMKLRGQTTTKELIRHGLTVGSHFSRRNDCKIDCSHAYMITIGDHVTLAGGVVILAHDASTKMHLGYTKIAPVTIGNRVFIGEKAIVMPGVSIGDNSIIGAGSVVTKSIPAGSVAAGNPARVIGLTDAYIEKHRVRIETAPKFGKEYAGDISLERIREIREKASDGGYIV